jgi:hypothetical protein
MKASIKIITVNKEFSKEDLDAMRRILNVLRAHDLAASLVIKRKIKQHCEIINSQLRVV